jgi:tetratricopeptide (TPR) repeat protein
MKPLEPPDSLCLQAAQGWLELGNHIEAEAELEKIAPELRAHPCVLDVRYVLYAVTKKWKAALDIAGALIELDPDNPAGYIRKAHALHELRLTEDACRHLQDVLDKFPTSATIRYNLACYECQLGNLERAKDWLEKAFKLGDARKMKLAALDDQDLQPLWKEIDGS